MKAIFAGTPEFAARALLALFSRHEVMLVLTQPDKPAGRGMKLQASAVKRLAQSRGIPVRQPPTLKNVVEQQALGAVGADVMVVAAYGLLLPQAVLDITPFGAINIHASLLPRWRGAAPIQRALLAGDRETGVSIMRIDAGLDTGPVLLREATPIDEEDTAQSLHDRLAAIGARLIVEALERLERGELSPSPQSTEAASYAAKVEKAEAWIDWSASATQIHRRVRAFNPTPGAGARLDGIEIKVWRAVPVRDRDGRPGEILQADDARILVACGEGALSLLELQRAGGKRLGAAEFLRGFAIEVGKRFET